MPFNPNGQVAQAAVAEEQIILGGQPAPDPGLFPDWVEAGAAALAAGTAAAGMMPNNVWAPQLGINKVKKVPIVPQPVNPTLPKMEFNVEAKKAKVWYRPNTKDDIKNAIALGYVVAEQVHHADEEDVVYWNPVKFPSVAHIGANRLATLQIHPDKKYLITHTALYKSLVLGGESVIAATLNKRSMQLLTEWQEAMGGQFIKWLGSPKFYVVDKEVLYA